MKEYMLIYKGGDPDWMENTPQEEMAAAMKQWEEWMSNLQEKGQLVSGGSPLNYSGKRISQDGVLTDISASEIKELVSGYSLIMAKNMDEAVAITRECPIFNHPVASAEIREVSTVET